MQSDQNDAGKDGPCRKWATRATADVIVASITFLVGAAMMLDSYRIGAGWAEGNLQPGYFPFRVGVIISAVSLAILLVSLLGRRRDTRLFVRRDEIKRVMAVLAPTLIYIFAVGIVGLYVASALFVAAFMRLGGKYGWMKTAAVSVGTSVTLFVLFEIVFLVPLPKGPLEAMLGY